METQESINNMPCFTLDTIKAAKFISNYSYDSDDDPINEQLLALHNGTENSLQSIPDVKLEYESDFSVSSVQIDDMQTDPFEINHHSGQSSPVFTIDRDLSVQEEPLEYPIRIYPIIDHKLESKPVVSLQPLKFPFTNSSGVIDKKVENSTPLRIKNTMITDDNQCSNIKNGTHSIPHVDIVEEQMFEEDSEDVIPNNTILDCVSNINKHIEESTSKLCFNETTNASDIQLVSGLERNFICYYCNRGFLQKQTMRKHIYICPKRNDGFIKVKKKAKVKKQIFECKVCRVTLSSKFCFQRHLENRHNVLKPFKCAVCRWEFYNEKALQHHCTKRHGVSVTKVFGCAYCASKFATRSELKQHCKEYHQGKQFYGCSVCLKSFQNGLLCKRHEESHGYKCDICMFVTQGREDMAAHILSHVHVVSFNCEICSRVFYQKANFLKHIKVHRIEKKVID